MALVFLGCAPSQTQGEGERLSVKVFELPKPGDPNIFFRARRAVVDAFLAKPENQNVELVPFSGLRAEGMDMEVGPLMGIAGGIAPDVLYVNFRKSDSYVQEGFLYPMDEFIIAESKNRGIPIDEAHPFCDDEVPELLKERVPKPVWPVIYRRGPDGQKHVYALPTSTLVIAMVYRKDLFLEAGLDPEKPPATWDELYDACVKITDPERGVYGIAMESGKGSSWRLMSYLWSAGAEAIVQDEQGEWRAAFDSDEAVLAYDFYRKLCQDPFEKYGRTYHGVVYRDPDSYRMWYQGKVGVFFDYLDASLMSQVNPELVGIAPVPRGPSGVTGSELNCRMMGLAAMTDPAKRPKAWEFIYYFDGEEARRIKTELFVQNGFGRFVNPAWLRKFGYTEYIRHVPKAWLDTFKQALKNGKPEPYGKNCDLIYHEMSNPLGVVVNTDYTGLTDDERRAAIKRTLEVAVQRTNEKMLGIMPPEVAQFRKRVALGVACLVVLAFVFVFRKIYQAFTPVWARDRGWEFRRYKWAYGLLAPAVLTILLWRYVPLLRGSLIAFQDYKIVHETTFVGLGNFAQVLFDEEFWLCLWRSTYYMLLMIGLGFWPPIFLAILLQEVPRGKILFRVLFYLPAVTSGLIIAFLWKQFYDPSEHGLLNQMLALYNVVPGWFAGHVPGLGWLDHLQIGPQKWLGDRHLAMLCVVLPQIWAMLGPGCIIYLAALKSIPDDFYEAADIDGASFVHKIVHIVIPYLKPLIIINFVGAFIAAFKSMNYVFIMTAGGPANATHVLGFEIWIRSFMYLKFGLGTAMAWILGSLLIGFTGYQLRILSRLQFKTATQDEDLA